LRSDHLQEQAFVPRCGASGKKFLIAQARMTKPCSIIFDEPCAEVVPGTRENFKFAAESRWQEKNTGR